MAPFAPRTILDPKLDIVFSLLFGAERNRRLLISLLNEVLQPSSPIESVHVLPPRPETESVEDKLALLDLRIQLSSGEQVDVEMQTRRHAALRARILFYWGRMYTSQVQRGQHHSALKRCAVILITNFKELDCPEFHSVFEVRERSRSQLLTDHLELHVLELPKLRDTRVRTDEPQLAGWCRFLGADTDEELDSMAMQHPILKEAKDALDELSADPEVRERAARRFAELALQDYGLELERQDARAKGLAEGRVEGLAEGRVEGLAEGRVEGLAEGRVEGLAEGRVEGQKQAKREVLRRLLEAKFGPAPAAIDTMIASANEPELDRWLERLLSATSLEAIF